MIDDYLVNLVLEILQRTTLNTLAPLRLFLIVGGVNVTNTFFGTPHITVNNWTLDSGIVMLSNTNEILFGVSNSNYFGSAVLQIQDQLNRVIVNRLFNVALEQGAEYRIPVGFLTISMTNVNANLGNFLLDRLRQPNINDFIRSPSYTLLGNDPTSWELLVSTSVLRALDKRFFSRIRKTIIGQLEISYGESFSVSNPNFHDVLELSVRKRVTGTYNATLDYSGRTWFNLRGASNLLFFPNQPIQIFNNTLNWVYNPPILDIDTVILPENPNSLVSLDFDGRLEDTSLGLSINNSSQIIYNSEIKRFDAQALYMGLAQTLDYVMNFPFPNRFTINLFFRLNSSPSGRAITFFSKDGVIGIEKPQASNNLVLHINTNSFIFFAPLVRDLDYHLYLSKDTNSTEVTVRLSSIDGVGVISSLVNQSVTLTSANITDNTNNLVFSSVVSVLDGWFQGFYMSSVVEPFQPFVQPTPKHEYYWSEIPTYVWLSPHFKFDHWLKLVSNKV